MTTETDQDFSNYHPSQGNNLEHSEPNLTQEANGTPGKPKSLPWDMLAVLLLLAVLALGAYFRFTGLDWDDTYHLHPDERFLTDVASLLHSTDPITYLKTSESTLNPYNFGRTFYVYGNFPMTVTRLVAEGVDNLCLKAGDICAQRYIYFDGIQYVGRFLSGFLDLISILFTFLIGKRLYDWRVGLIGATLMAAAVLPIQQSHFFTMDNWAAVLTTMTLYAAIRASENARQKAWWLAFGLGLGLAVASRINLAPLAIMAVVAAFVWIARRSSDQQHIEGLRYILSLRGSDDLQSVIIGLAIAAFVSLITFRLAQPYAFADRQIVENTIFMQSGEFPGLVETAIRSLVSFNPLWRANLTEIQNLQSPDALFPPALQWTDRAPILFPLTNMILWGMGITAGIAAFLGLAWATWRIVRGRPDWAAHFMLVTWIGMYFLFMATRWVKSIRYFLPIYPFLMLMAGWALVELWKRAGHDTLKRMGVILLIILVIGPTLLWANAFVDIYRNPVTRIKASEWMFENVPSGASLLYAVDGQEKELQLPLRRFEFIPGGPPVFLQFMAPENGTLTGVRFNYLSDPDVGFADDSGESLRVELMDITGSQTLAKVEHNLDVDEQRQPVQVNLDQVPLVEGTMYNIVAEAGPGGPFSASTSILANEHWDDSLPVRYEGRDPYSAYYEGLSEGLIPITIPDSEEKRTSFYRWLDESDYIVLSSQRALWSIPRLPLTYPLTIRYYEALFNGELGFDLVGQFQSDLKIGPLYMSDVAGSVAWGQPVQMGWPPPGPLAAEEAFSVYDHPPVWLFAKNEDYRPERVREILGAVDISNVMVMTPGQATSAPNGLMLSTAEQDLQRNNGTFNEIFNVDGILSQNPWLAAIIWWIAVVFLGWIAFPIAFIAFSGLQDRGYTIARILSLLIISYFAWILASLRLLPHTRNTLALGLILMAISSLIIAILRRRQIANFVRDNLAFIGLVELIGLVLYLSFIIIRLGNPDVWDVIWGGEKPMDLSYFNAVLKSTVFPPYDPWFSGGYINYYYYGFVYVGAITKLLGIVPTVAYNLILPMLGAFTGLGAFSIAYNLVAFSQIRMGSIHRSGIAGASPKKIIKPAVFAGLLTITLIVFLGNLAEVGVVVNTWFKAGDTSINMGISAIDAVVRTVDGGLDLTFTDKVAPIYPGDWFWTATRAINAEPGEVQPITEFPFFTFLYGDLHAHMIALPLTLLALAWAISLVLPGIRQSNSVGKKPLYGQILLTWLVGGLSIGVLRATNTWDFPTYLLIGVLAAGYNAYQRRGRLDLKTLGQATIQAIALAAIAIVLFLPFAENYGVPYTSFSLWPGSYTHVTNYLFIYGLFLLLIITHLALEFRSWTKSWTQQGLVSWERFVIPVFIGLMMFTAVSILLLVRGYWIGPIVLTLVSISGLLALRQKLPIERRVVLILIAGALALTLLVELIVLDGDIGRMNTVFKFYLQVWVILSVIGGVVAIWAWPKIVARRNVRRAWSAAFLILFLAAALYPLLATKAKWDIRMSDEAPITLDGMAFMQTTSYNDTALDGSSQTISLNFDYEALKWIQRNIEGSPVIAEAHTLNPYRAIANRVSMYTGLPSIVGWDWHQRQQRAVLPPTVVSDRILDVNQLYNTIDQEEALSIIDKYDVSYIYVGPLEWTYYNPQGLIKFDRMVEAGLLQEVYRNSGVSIYQVNRSAA